MFDFSRYSRAAAAMIGALVLTTVSVGAAVGPATAFDTATVPTAQAQAAVQADA